MQTVVCQPLLEKQVGWEEPSRPTEDDSSQLSADISISIQTFQTLKTGEKDKKQTNLLELDFCPCLFLSASFFFFLIS